MNNPIAFDLTFFTQIVTLLILALLIYLPIRLISNKRRRDEETNKKLDHIIELLENTDKNSKEI